MSNRGIILITTGHAFYGRMAYNLAVSIKAVEDIPICVLWNGAALNHLSEKQMKVFDTLIEIKETSFASKLEMYDYSPFEETLYFDADTVWLPKQKPSDLFDQLKDVQFTGITEGYYDFDTMEDKGNKMYHYWCEPLDSQKAYDLKGKYYQFRSEVLFFRKGEVAKKIFDDAKEIYKNPKINFKQFAHHMPDELAINISTCMNGVQPHKYQWKPAYWHRLHGEGKGLNEIVYDYFLLSAGGNYATGTMKNCYNKVCMAAHRKLGLQYLFTLQSKKSVMPDRVKM